MANRIYSGYSNSTTTTRPLNGYTYIDLSMESTYTKNKYNKTGYPFKLASSKDIHAVNQSIKNIFTWTCGERILNPEFGSNLRRYLYEGITDLNSELIVVEIRNALMTFEPRVTLVSVQNISTLDDTEDNTVHIRIVYTINGLDNRTFAFDYTQPVYNE